MGKSNELENVRLNIPLEFCIFCKWEIGEIQRIRKWEIETSIPIPKSQNESNPDAVGGGLDLF